MAETEEATVEICGRKNRQKNKEKKYKRSEGNSAMSKKMDERKRSIDRKKKKRIKEKGRGKII